MVLLGPSPQQLFSQYAHLTGVLSSFASNKTMMLVLRLMLRFTGEVSSTEAEVFTKPIFIIMPWATWLIQQNKEAANKVKLIQHNRIQNN